MSHVGSCTVARAGHGSGACYKGSTLSGEKWRLLICAVGVDPVADMKSRQGA